MTRLRKIHKVKETPFELFYGGAEVEGQNKWVVSAPDNCQHILDAYLYEDQEDQLWYSKEEATENVQDWWSINQSKFA